MNWDYGFWLIIVGLYATAVMINKYQWRKAWEAYYKRPLLNGEEHKPPNLPKEKEEVL